MENSATLGRYIFANADDFDRGVDFTDGASRRPIPMARVVGEGLIEVQNLNIGAFLGRRSFRFQERYRDDLFQPFREVEVELKEPTLMVHSTNSGRGFVSDKCVDQTVEFNANTSFVGLHDHIAYSTVIGNTDCMEVTILIAGMSCLREFLGEKVAAELISGLGLDGRRFMRSVEMPCRISTVLHQTFSPELRGEIRGLYSQAKTLEYLSLLADHVTGEKSCLPLMTDRKIRSLREEVEGAEGTIPPLNELANKYGASVRTLNEGFRQKYGKTIGKFLLDLRLSKARDDILHTDMALKVIAVRHGYSHVNNFITAFKKAYGCPPGALRRSRGR